MNKTPVYTTIKAYIKENNSRFHMPGHIGGQGLVEDLQAVASLDVTEVPGLDDLHLPRQAILEARILLASAYGAENSLFLVNGATSGIHALFLSLTPDANILVPRNAHRSFYGGMILSGVWPVYIPPQIEKNLGIALSVMPQEIKRHLDNYPRAEAVFITSPSYYGTTSDVTTIAQITKEYGKLLYVDEAHGGHFPFHPEYPPAALKSGADAVVNGLHKTLPVLNQGAVLHCGSQAPWFKIESSFSLLTTTSPSYPILASLDLAREFMISNGESMLEQSLLLSRQYKKRINNIQGLKCLNDELFAFPGVTGVDPLKVLISIENPALNGFMLASLLRSEHNIQIELAEEKIILAMMSLFHRAEEWDKLYQALKSIAGKYFIGSRPTKPIEIPPWTEVMLSPRQAFFAPKRKVKFSECQGHIAGEMVAVYPPGIPCLLPGETISPPIFDYLQYIKGSKTTVQGLTDPELNYINVIEL
ncbi:MAG TPA: aminotransferase class I/II-fold pyridoxal phosphate-dependent enzyme [Syntrophomonadaceae bacterium]|nr:aminotransferase class I/II-fold pyridoxal phosphate-dependent enzyme [Syntrophomonadaceae bacterium]HPR93242.1 aminotransferase class I/II-fold pyridoxal phosphate-dependent enzyme [Syntrophomonadaceae bacterium]